MKYAALLLLIFSFANTLSAQRIEDYNNHLSGNQQVLFVTVPTITSVQGTMVLYQRKNSRTAWKASDSFAVVEGRAGLAKDAQTNVIMAKDLPIKKEGDGKSPAGIFPLGDVFSYHDLRHLHMPFKQVDTLCHCVDDPSSVYYNTLIVADTARQAYNSFEYMKRRDDFYEYGVWVLYNSNPAIAGSGSCIFIHVWKDDNSGTSGCTAMSKEHVIELIHWLDRKKNPVLLQVVEE